MSRNNTKSRNAFTLIEMMIVASLLGLLATAVIVNVDSYTDRGRLEAAANRLGSINKIARLAGQMRGQPVRLIYDLDEQVIRWSESRYSLGSSLRIAWVQTGPTDRFDKGQVVLNIAPGGLVPGHAVAVTDSRQTTIVCWIAAATAQLRCYQEAEFVFPTMR